MRKLIYALLVLAWLAAAQGVHPTSGRRIAGMLEPERAGWLVRNERDAEEHVDAALDAIGIAKGSTVADVGAGAGYVTWRLAERVGRSGKVYANEIQPEMLELLRKNMAREKVANVRTVLGTATDPKLPRGAIDLVLLVDVYHEFSQPQQMLRRIREALKPHGRLVLLEYREDPEVPVRPEHKMTVAQVRAELEPEGFRLDRLVETLPRQHILIFRK
jgi:tRNA A58 N-methylase Trm61